MSARFKIRGVINVIEEGQHCDHVPLQLVIIYFTISDLCGYVIQYNVQPKLSEISCIPMSDDIYKELFTAVHKGDIEKVRDIFTLSCVDVRTREIWVECPFLHCADTADMIKLILSHGADINAKDINGLTPLHSAITTFKGVSVIRELLIHGANVNATDYEGNTPLTLAIIYEYLEGIKELLENGADVNIKSTSSFLGYSTPLCIAVRDYKDCAKIIIKMVLRKYFKDFGKVINLDPYISFANHREISDYLEKCIDEIHRMEINKVNKHLTIFELVIEKEAIKPLYVSYDIIEKDILYNYPIYHDVILPQIELCINRSKLFDKLKDLQICLVTTNRLDRIIILNTDCVFKIANYLTNEDLNNLIESI